MSQREVINLLSKNKDWISTRDICKKLANNPYNSSISVNLMMLRKYNEVLYKKVNQMYWYKIKKVK